MRTSTSLFLLAALACGDPGPPAVSVGPVSYTEDQLLGLSPARRATLAHITGLALATADSTLGALGAPLVERWTEERLLDVLAAELTLEKHGIGDDVLEARYLTDPDWELTVRHILFFSERWRTAAERTAAAAKAERALERLTAGADFAETAASLSEEPGAEGRQGLLTPGREGAWVDEFWAAASALDVGEISSVTETQYGYHILRLEGREVVPFAEARSRLARAVADRIEDPAAVLSVWLDEAVPDGDAPARRRAALEEVSRRGLALPDEERAALDRQWDDMAQRWAAALGFTHGLGPDQVGSLALAALAQTAQGAAIAREEIDAHADLIRARYRIDVAGETGPPAGP